MEMETRNGEWKRRWRWFERGKQSAHELSNGPGMCCTDVVSRIAAPPPYSVPLSSLCRTCATTSIETLKPTPEYAAH